MGWTDRVKKKVMNANMEVTKDIIFEILVN